MIKLAKNLIIMVLFISIGCCEASVLTYEQLVKTINNKVNIEIKQQLLNVSEDFKINITGIPKENYSSNESLMPKVEIISQNLGFIPNSYKRVVIKDSKNNILKTFPINVQTLVYKDVLVASSTIPYNQEIKPDYVTLEKREISKYTGKTLSSLQSGLIASRNFPKGGIILSDYVKTKSVVSKNSIVEIIFLSDKGLKITLRGKAMKDGGIGDTIPVRSDKYNKIYNAKISSFNEVTVRI